MNALPLMIETLERMPRDVEALFRLVPPDYWHWTPESWDAIPGERFSPAGQACHLRDIEIEGYQVRIRRMREEHQPVLDSLDSYEIAKVKHYAESDPLSALAVFRQAREETVELLRSISPRQFARTGTFAEYGELTLGALVHYLCSHDQQHLACMQWLLGKIDSHSQNAMLK